MKDFKIVEEKDLIEFLNNAGGNKPIIANDVRPNPLNTSAFSLHQTFQ